MAQSVLGSDGVLHAGITCRACRGYGHYSDTCPGGSAGNGGITTTSGTTLTQYAFVLAQSSNSGINPNWILLDSQSTISVFCNHTMLSNIRRGTHTLRAITNGGHQDSEWVGDFPNLGEVWYNPHSIANILSLADVRKVCRVTMDSSLEPSLNVHRLDGSVMKFIEHDSGLYIYKSNVTNEPVTGYSLLSTVADQKKLFSRREIKAADAARDLYRKIGRPDEAEFQTILRRNLIRNCPVTPADAKRALIIYGPDIAVLKGKSTRSEAALRVPTFEAVPIPPPVLKHHRNVTLCLDFFFVQGLVFYHSISRGIGYRTVKAVSDRSKNLIVTATKDVIRLYQHRGFQVCDIHADHEFECARDALRPVDVNIVPTDSHVGEVERSIRTIKERLRSCVHGLPFKRLPKLLIRHMVANAVRCLNQFPWKNGNSDDLSPAALVTGHTLPDYTAMQLEFGTYVQVFEDNDPFNTPRARSMGAIALDPTGNAQGDYNFMSLATGAKITRHKWIALPMTDTAIAHVEALGFEDDQPLIQDRGLVVEWRHDDPIDDYEYDANYVPPNDPVTADFFNPAVDYAPLDDNEAADLLHDAQVHGLVLDPADDDVASVPGAQAAVAPHNENWFFDNEQLEPVIIEADEEHADNIENDHDVFDEDEGAHNEGAPPNNNEHEDATHDNTDNEGAQNEADDEQSAEDNDEEAHENTDDQTQRDDNDGTTHRYNLRERGATRGRFNDAIDKKHDGRSYFPPTQLTQRGIIDRIRYIYAKVMTQMSAKAGIKEFGQDAVAALMRELAQFEDLGVYEAVDSRLLTRAQRRCALRAINLIKKKRDGNLKGRTVADGSVQRSIYDKVETASPTVATDALLLTILIDAHEGRDVATADVAGAYLKAYMDDLVFMKFTGESVDILCKMNPEHAKFVVIEKGVKVLYVKLIKAIYGCKVCSLVVQVILFHITGFGFRAQPL